MKIKFYTQEQIDSLEIRVPSVWRKLQNHLISEIEACEEAEGLTGNRGLYLPTVKDFGEEKPR